MKIILNVLNIAAFLEEVDTVRRHSVAEVPVGKNRNTPVLVHCGAGVGRTGVTIACDVLLNMLNHNIVRVLHIVYQILELSKLICG